jgi:hypothetical protein
LISIYFAFSLIFFDSAQLLRVYCDIALTRSYTKKAQSFTKCHLQITIEPAAILCVFCETLCVYRDLALTRSYTKKAQSFTKCHLQITIEPVAILCDFCESLCVFPRIGVSQRCTKQAQSFTKWLLLMLFKHAEIPLCLL